jgi:hypothetical protein
MERALPIVARTCFDFCSLILVRSCDPTKEIIEYVRQDKSDFTTYSELEALYRKWKAIDAKLRHLGP